MISLDIRGILTSMTIAITSLDTGTAKPNQTEMETTG